MTSFFQITPNVPEVSGWTDDLIEKPEGYYKFASIIFWPSNEVIKSSRQTYSLLDWLGDIGGLNDALFIILEVALIPFKRFTLGSFVLTRLFRFKKDYMPKTRLFEKDTELGSLKRTFWHTKSIPEMNYLAYFICRKSNRRKEYRKQMAKAAMQISKEMDLKKFIMR